MPHASGHQHENQSPSHHSCGNLFGCGEENGTGVLREDIKDAAFTRRAADRLLHMDEMNQEQLDGYLTARGLFAPPAVAGQQLHGCAGGHRAMVQ